MMSSRAQPFIQARKQHDQETAEDYTELVADLIEEYGEARTCDIAKQMGVSHVTAVRSIARLQKAGYLDTAPRRPVRLTSKGKEMAERCKVRHEILMDYLLWLGVPQEIAASDVEGMEHHISPETLAAFERQMHQSDAG